jgi:uncharacterized lipoprotein
MRPLLALLAILALAGCGGDSGPEQVVRDFATAIDKGDADRLCEELVTQEFAEQITLAQGDGAREECKKQIGMLKGRTFKVVKVIEAKERGDTATVRAQIEQRGQRRSQLFRLEEEDGDLRLTSAR